MSANDYIATLVKRNEKLFKGQMIKISNRELRKQIQLAFDAGMNAGKEARSTFERIFGR